MTDISAIHNFGVNFKSINMRAFTSGYVRATPLVGKKCSRRLICGKK